MRCRHDVGSKFGWNHFPAVSGYTKVLSEKGLGRTRPKAYKNLWLHNLQLRVEPWAACLNLGLSRLLMDTPLTTFGRHPFEMLDHVGDINLGALDSHFNQNLIEQVSRGANERLTLAVFLISGLLANKHNQRLGRPFPENRLRRVFPEITSSTSCCSFSKGHNAEPWREIRGSRRACSSLGHTLTSLGGLADRLGLSGDVRPGLPAELVAATGETVGSEGTRKILGINSLHSAFGNSS